MIEATTISAHRDAGRVVRNPAIGTKHLLWKDLRTFGLPAAILVGGYVLMMLLAYLFCATHQDFLNASRVIQGFAAVGLVMLWAIAAGAIVVAGDAEDGTETWMRSLPITPLRLFVVRSLIAFGSVLATAMLCSVGFLWTADSPSGATSAPPWGGSLGYQGAFVNVVLYLITLGSFFVSGLFSGVLTRRVLPAVVLGAVIPLVVLGVVQGMLDTPKSAKNFALLQGAIAVAAAIAAMVYSARCYVAGLGPRITTATTAAAHPLTGLRRWMAAKVSPDRPTRSLAWREMVSLSLFVPWAFLTCAAAYFFNHPVAVFCLTMAVRVAAGVASAVNDSRDDSLPFLTHRGRSAVRVWLTKTLTWGLATLAVMLLVTVVAEAINGANPNDRWDHSIDQHVPHGKIVPSSMIATLYCSSAPANAVDWHGRLVGPLRLHAVKSALAIAATLLLMGQAVGFWFRRKIVAFAIVTLAAILWLYLHTVLTVLATPFWSVSVVPVACLALLAFRACQDAVYENNRWVRRAGLAVLLLAGFYVAVPASRLLATPSAGVTTVQRRPEPDVETAGRFRELDFAFRRHVVLPERTQRALLAEISPEKGRRYGTLRHWIDSQMSGTIIAWDTNEHGAKLDDAAFTFEDWAPLKSNGFLSPVEAAHAFREAIEDDPAMPAGCSFKSSDIVTQVASLLAIDAVAKLHEDKPEEAAASWTAAWDIVSYFARHDGEWTCYGVPASPWSNTEATSSRHMLLSLANGWLDAEALTPEAIHAIRIGLIGNVPDPRRELADAANRICIDGYGEYLQRVGSDRPFAARMVDRFLGLPGTQFRTNYAGVAVLQRLGEWGSQATHLGPQDAAKALGIPYEAFDNRLSLESVSAVASWEYNVANFIDAAESQFDPQVYPSAMSVQELYERVLSRTAMEPTTAE